MIVVRGIDDGFAFQLRIGARQHGDYIVRFERPNLADDMRPQLRRQRHRTKIPRAGLGDHLVQIHSRPGGEITGHIKMNPRRHGQLWGAVELQIGLFSRIRVAHHFPGIAGHLGLVDQHCTHCAFARRFFELVRPAAVISQRTAIKKLGIVGGRLVHQHQQHLALHVDAFVIVPVVLRRLDAIADKHDVGIDVGDGLLVLVVANVIGQKFQFLRLRLWPGPEKMSFRKWSSRPPSEPSACRCRCRRRASTRTRKIGWRCTPPRCRRRAGRFRGPSSKSWDKKRTCARMRSGSIFCSAAIADPESRTGVGGSAAPGRSNRAYCSNHQDQPHNRAVSHAAKLRERLRDNENFLLYGKQPKQQERRRQARPTPTQERQQWLQNVASPADRGLILRPSTRAEIRHLFARAENRLAAFIRELRDSLIYFFDLFLYPADTGNLDLPILANPENGRHVS